MKPFFRLFLLLVLFCSCNNQDDTSTTDGSLQAYIDGNNNLFALNELVACAAGGQEGFLEDAERTLSIFFYPELASVDFKYFETDNITVDPLNLNAYKEIKTISEPLFNGFLRRFSVTTREKEVWGRVSFIANDTLWYSKAIRIKENTKPTEFAPELCQIDQINKLTPIFTWKDGSLKENFIYFHVISDENNNALSGTYTNDKRFQYYKLDNVVFNVTRAGQAIPLQKDKNYTFTLMGVSQDNWVNLIMQKDFIAK